MRDGCTELQVCKNLGISVCTINEYKKKYPELVKALRKGRDVAITELENALFKRAAGMSYEETKVSIRDVDGVQVKFTEKTTKYALPDVAAIYILLKNKDRGNWSDNPVKADLERQMFEFHKLIETAKVFGEDIEELKPEEVKALE
ncbi:conserved hypothetical protein [Candidatus Desulfosporosinus infrequens]|uniref:Uncharacterized protein n=1 Tax=Candidatus Desulfosporosinus infrequens TaxID=2043169 RepID=A0A2U3LUT9_9FIRM|nr:conserved hypothetical protein [Candidatus Desulfosporosinus infrequens]